MGDVIAFPSKEVYILGAGFTKAFADDAPLLLDNYDTNEIKKFDAFDYTHAILEDERSRCPKGKLNLERLMTRLDGGMPYDWTTGDKDMLRALLAALKRSLLEKLRQAKAAGNVRWDELNAFANHCRKNRISCITFNYDDFLDQALSQTAEQQPRSGFDEPTYWHPDWGYGFFCNSSVAGIGASHGIMVTRPRLSMYLLKLHGSINWRVRHGHPSPYTTDAMTHFEDWWTIPEYHGDLKKHELLRSAVAPYLEPEPFLVPPVLTKSDLVEQPVLRVIWSLAVEMPESVEKVTFVGYSLPVTDIAAGTLFRESLGHLTSNVEVVNCAALADMADKKEQLLQSYREVFPGLSQDQIRLSGALEWARELCRG